MILSIIIYTLSAFIFYYLAKSADLKDQRLKMTTGKTISFSSQEYILTFVFFCFIAGARYNVGIDHLQYLSDFKSMRSLGWFSRDTYEVGFQLITEFFAASGLHYFFYFAFWAFLQIFFIYKSCEDEKFLLPYIALNIMLGPYFLDWMNGIRQCVVICYFVFSIRFIEQRKPLPFLVGIVIAFTIHRSAVIMLPFYLLGLKQVTLKKKFVNYVIIAICIWLGTNPYWISITSGIERILMTIGYNKYSENYTSMVDIGSFNEMSWGPSRFGILFSQMIIIWFYPNMRVFYKKSRKLDIYFFIFYIGVCLYNLFANTSHIFLRPIEYLTIFMLPLAAYTMYYLKKTKNEIWFTALCILLFCYIYFVIYKSVYHPSTYSESNLYKFFFFENIL